MRYAMLAVGLVFLLALSPARGVEKAAIDRAVDRGIAFLKSQQQSDGTWSYTEIGATALAALALLEADVPKTDKSIVAAAKAVREAALKETKTYSCALSVLFLDRLDDPQDTPVIESLVVRLLAGQRTDGGWGYSCPKLAEEEIKRIRAEMDPSRSLAAGRDLKRLPEKGKRKREDLAKETQAQVKLVEKLGGGAADEAGMNFISDNSNTQFATLGLWVGRRYGVPTHAALAKGAARFRLTQNNDGGWSYTSGNEIARVTDFGSSSAAMTCAGLFALAAAHGVAHDVKKAKDDKADKEDLSKDKSLGFGLAALGTAVGNPVGWKGDGKPHPAIPPASDKAYYFLWSLERVGVSLNLETIGKKDWYNWGAEILLANQRSDGSWIGAYPTAGSDTAFALMFLKKANLARDLSGALRLPKGGEARVLKGNSDGVKTPRDLSVAGLGGKGKSTEQPRRSEVELRAIERAKPKPESDADKKVVGLADELTRAGDEERAALIKRLRDGKGAIYTETLVYSILRLTGEDKRQARVALAERLSRLKDTTLREYLKDDEAEIRRAAALAAAARGSKVLVPDLIQGLTDSEDLVRRAAYAALKDLTKKDFGPGADADESQRKTAVAAWQKWWKENSRE